ncbi:MAG: hypothetical protein SWO11_04620 [Thermodesulfobacteriota bacterium]|nr:hypothetical protein [Thermodesulfobacteriota bacterium]
MECPKCGHNVPTAKDKCMYCGFSRKKSPFADVKETTKTSKSAILIKSDENGRFSFTANVKEKVYKDLEDIPKSLRATVQEALRKGEKNISFEQRVDTYTSPLKDTHQPQSSKEIRDI